MLGKLSIDGVQVLTVDRFQGSENKVIILSLVRSNEEGSVGHVGKRNRLCVAVSRARGGMYFCGNDVALAKKSVHWRTLLDYLSEKKCVGNTIYLRCPRHPASPPFAISSKEAHSFNPDLCKKPCNNRLKCRHYCQKTCHFGDHPKCKEPVQFVFSSCGHEANIMCSEDKEKQLCQLDVFHIFDHCRHVNEIKCWKKTSKELKCSEPCRNVLDCGHPCRLKCYENCKANPCSACVQIQKAKAEKERLMAAKQLQLKLKEVEAEIDKLKARSDQDLMITDLSPTGETAAEYFQVKDRTEKFIQEGHEEDLFVTKIEKVLNPKLQIKFLEAQRDLFSPEKPTQQLFHGTDDGGVGGITKDGFRLPAINKNNMFGQGCYFATDSSKGAQKIYTKGSNKLLLCDVLLGRTWTVQKDYPDMDLEKIKKKGYDSLFSKRGGRGTGGTLYDEYVVYNPYQAIPRYIVHYKNQHRDLRALNPHHFPHNLTRIPYLPSSTFNGDDAAEYRFRQAESQFYRMSSGGNHKVVKVEYILNKLLQSRYDRAKQEFEAKNKKMQQMLVFHGTDQNAIEKIVQEGFKIGGQGVSVRNGSAFGAGVYTALDPDTSVDYSRGSGMMLLSFALVGQEGIDFNKGRTPDVIVLPRADILLPSYSSTFSIVKLAFLSSNLFLPRIIPKFV
eukprot:Gb_11774 [translate_table: standard]